MAYRTTHKMAARKAAKRRALLDVATRLFGENGFHATTVPQIVEEARSSTGSFYFYFDNKEHVFADVLRAVGERFAAALDEAIAGAGGSEVEHMRAAVVATFEFLAANPTDARILIVESSGLTPELAQVRQEIHDSHARSVELALRGLAPDRIGDMDARVLARCWTGAVYEAVRWWLVAEPGARPSPERMGEVVARFNLRGVGAPYPGP